MASRYSIATVFTANDKVSAPINKMRNRIDRTLRATRAGVERVDRSMSKLSSNIMGVAKTAFNIAAIGIGGIAASVTLFTREFSKIEDAEAAFTPLMGGAKRAKELVDALNETSASTPFQFENLADTANQLLPIMNGNIEKTIKTIRMLGDTSGGNAQKLDSITRGFTKAMLKGKVDLESLNMIGEAGVPIFQQLASVMGTEVNESFFKMISAGKVTTQQLTKAFEKMTSEGGIFFGGMEIASKTTSGLWSTLKDNISLTAAEIGSVLSPVVKDLLGNSISIAQKVRDWVKANKELISEKFLKFVESIKTTTKTLIDNIIALNEKNDILKSFTDAFESLVSVFSFLGKHGKTIAILTAAILGLNLALKAVSITLGIINVLATLNPFGLMVVGAVALIGVFTALFVWTDDIIKSFESMPNAIRLILTPLELLLKGIRFVKENIGSLGNNVLGFLGFGDDKKEQSSNPQTQMIRPSSKVVKDNIGSLGNNVLGFLGLGDNKKEQTSKPQTQMVSPSSRVAKNIQETRESSSAEITIRDDSGRAEVTKGTLSNNINMTRSGGF